MEIYKFTPMKRTNFLILLIVFFLIQLSASSQELYKLNGELITYQEAIKQEITILFLWTSGCSACRDNIRYLDRSCPFDDDINIQYVNLGDSKKDIKDFLRYYGITDCISDNILMDKQSSLSKKFPTIFVPTVIFLQIKYLFIVPTH